MPPDVSVLVPSFNGGRFLRLALRSALDQDGVDLEIVVQDGGSTDDSLASAGTELADSRVLLRSEPDGGQADALNRALARAGGRWIAWLNADDLLEPDGLRTLIAAAGDDADVVFGDFQTIDEEGRPLKRYTAADLELHRLLRHGHYVFSGALLVRRDVLQRLGGFRADLEYCMDFDLLLRIATSATSRHVDAVVASFREHGGGKTSTSSWGFVLEHVRVARAHGGFRRELAAGTTRAVAAHALYVLTRPVWRTAAWRRLRPQVHRGGR